MGGDRMARTTDDELNARPALALQREPAVLAFRRQSLPVASPNEQLFADLFARMYDKLVRYAAKHLRGDEDAAEDLVQSALVVLWHRYFRGDATPPESLDGLAFRAV